MFPWRIINSRVLQIAKALFRYKIWFMISEKGITRCTSSPVVLACPKSLSKACKKIVYQNFQFFLILSHWFLQIWTCIYLQKGGISKNSREKIMQCFGQLLLIYKKMLNMKLNMMLIVFMKFTYIRYFSTLQKIQWIPWNLSWWWIWLWVCL